MKARTKHYLESLVAGGFGGLLPSRSVRRVFISSVSVCEYWNNNKRNSYIIYKKKITTKGRQSKYTEQGAREKDQE